MSDIVTRLWGNTGDKYPGFENLNTEAAAEIERLRARVAELEKDRDSWKREALAAREHIREITRRSYGVEDRFDTTTPYNNARAANGEVGG